MAISLQELEKLIYEQQTGTKLDGKLKNADPSESISVNITLHAETWRQILVLKTYYTLKGSRGFNTLSSTIFMIATRVYKGLLNSLAKRLREEAEEHRATFEKIDPPSDEEINSIEVDGENGGGQGGNPGFGY
ncbi:MAG: hypothetical protein IJ177_10240 [Fibrobacter sp.]|uniref:hypothetical protein n=1 Tax=Fibrobacter sp. TaxID=35828 RepID=UPI0025BD2BF5|nr:hypothetical protein [Fibrobacter sp.]MBQ9226546.1 hypothetical protein [Fibrobacter sp.]